MPNWFARVDTAHIHTWAAAAALSAALTLLAACGAQGHKAPYQGALEVLAAEITAHSEDAFPAAPPPFTEGIFPCSRCHGDAPPPDEGEAVFPHVAHLEKGLECEDCHEDDAAPTPADAEFCDECHEPGDRGSERATAYFAGLTDGFPSRWDVTVKSPAHETHQEKGVACAGCHGQPSNAPFGKPGAAVLMQRCTTCHAEREASIDCETCHEAGTEAPHANIVLHHAEAQRGCLDCHDANDRDVLHLANGTPIPFEQSYRLCGQCHGPRLRDWRLGIHGKRTGTWDGRKEYLLCANCHNPHSPRFPQMVPLPPPTRPKEVR